MSGGIANAILGRTDVVKNDQYLGAVKRFMDKNHSDPNDFRLLSGAPVIAVYVKNGHNAAIAPGTGITFKTTNLGKEIGGLSGADGRCDGVVDGYIPAAGLAVGSYGWVIVTGPTKVLIGTGGVSQGNAIQTAANGTFIALTDGNTFAVGRSGIMDADAADTALGRCWLNLSREAVIPGFGAC